MLVLKPGDTSMLVPIDAAHGTQRLFNTLFKSDWTSWEIGLKIKIFSDFKTPYTGDKAIMKSSYER